MTPQDLFIGTQGEIVEAKGHKASYERLTWSSGWTCHQAQSWPLENFESEPLQSVGLYACPLLDPWSKSPVWGVWGGMGCGVWDVWEECKDMCEPWRKRTREKATSHNIGSHDKRYHSMYTPVYHSILQPHCWVGLPPYWWESHKGSMLAALAWPPVGEDNKPWLHLGDTLMLRWQTHTVVLYPSEAIICPQGVLPIGHKRS